MVPDFLTIAEAAKLIETKELSPVELVDSRLARIERFDGKLHSFIRVLADSARAEARAAEAEIAAAAHYIADMAARLRPPGGRNVAAEPAHVVKFPEG